MSKKAFLLQTLSYQLLQTKQIFVSHTVLIFLSFLTVIISSTAKHLKFLSTKSLTTSTTFSEVNATIFSFNLKMPNLHTRHNPPSHRTLSLPNRFPFSYGDGVRPQLYPSSRKSSASSRKCLDTGYWIDKTFLPVVFFGTRDFTRVS